MGEAWDVVEHGDGLARCLDVPHCDDRVPHEVAVALRIAVERHRQAAAVQAVGDIPRQQP
jgi:hypothetical protein